MIKEAYISNYSYIIPKKEKYEKILTIDNSLIEECINKIETSNLKKYALIYSCGVVMLPSAPNEKYYRNNVEIQKETKNRLFYSTLTPYHKIINYISKFKNKPSYLDIDSTSCASSIVSIHKALQLLEYYDNVLIISESKITHEVESIFRDFNINITLSDGFCYTVISKEKTDIKIKNTNIEYKLNGINPFEIDIDTITKNFDGSNYVKPHYTFTKESLEKENNIINKFKKAFIYKNKFGHMQGTSGLSEILYMIDSEPEIVNNDVFCYAVGFGGFYGFCTIDKSNTL